MHQSLIADNTALQSRDLMMRSKLQKMLVLQKENKQLGSLLSGKTRISSKVTMARILAIQTNPSLQQFVINQGVSDKVYIGQPVLDGYGVMGKIVSVGPLSSRALLVNDDNFSIPVKDYRNGLRAIASGTQQPGLMVLDNVARTSDIRVGDMFVTSGFALQFPVGYPVGHVISIQRKPGVRFLRVEIEPAAHLDQSQLVLLAWPEQAKLRAAVSAQLHAPLPDLTK
jgi:rod shape-determining protein MreC